nr:MAG TPA: hypothetical protein [Caudoviricetes sp.]
MINGMSTYVSVCLREVELVELAYRTLPLHL